MVTLPCVTFYAGSRTKRQRRSALCSMLYLQILGPRGIKIIYTIQKYNAVLKRSTKCVVNARVPMRARACLHRTTFFDFIISHYPSLWQLSDNCNSVLKI